MGKQLFSNAARSLLGVGINSVETSLTIQSGGDKFPVVANGDWITLTLEDANGIEIIYCQAHTSASTTFSSLVRGQEGTAARNWAAGAAVGLRLTANDFGWVSQEKVVASVAELQAAPLRVGDIVKTLGYNTPGDGGGATYEIVSAGTGTADGGGLITLTNNLQARAHFPGNVVRLSQFGATGVYFAPRTAPDSLGSWVDLGGGSYRLQLARGAAYTPMTFNTEVGKSYRISGSRNNTGIVNYDVGLFQANGAEIGLFAAWWTGFVAPSNGVATATGTTMRINTISGWGGDYDVTLSHINFVRADSDIAQLNAALARFGATKTGRLVIDKPSYLYTTSSITIPSNVDLEFVPGGSLIGLPGMTINSQLIADNRAILPKTLAATFGPRQRSVLSNWFGL